MPPSKRTSKAKSPPQTTADSILLLVVATVVCGLIALATALQQVLMDGFFTLLMHPKAEPFVYVALIALGASPLILPPLLWILRRVRPKPPEPTWVIAPPAAYAERADVGPRTDEEHAMLSFKVAAIAGELVATTVFLLSAAITVALSGFGAGTRPGFPTIETWRGWLLNFETLAGIVWVGLIVASIAYFGMRVFRPRPPPASPGTRRQDMPHPPAASLPVEQASGTSPALVPAKSRIWRDTSRVPRLQFELGSRTWLAIGLALFPFTWLLLQIVIRSM